MLITQGLHRAPWLHYSFPPHPLCPLLWGGGGEKLPWLPRHGPLGGGGSSSTCATEVAASAPCAPPPEGWGGDRPMSPAPDAPPFRGGGGGQCPLLWLMTPPAPPSAGGRCPQKYPPALGREGGDEDAVVRPPRMCVRPSALPALVTPVAVPRVLPLARRFPLGGAGRAGRAASALPARLAYRSHLGYAAPPLETHGRGG